MDPSIPTVDLEDIASHEPARVEQASAAIREALGTYGLIYLRNHGINTVDLDRFYDAFRAFVARPEEQKRPYGRVDLWFQRGWTPPNTEIAVASSGQPDFKECYFAAPVEVDPRVAAQYPELYPENIWPDDEPAGFREGYLALGKALHRAGLALLRGAAMALGLPDDTFTRMVEGGPHVTRALNYLPLSPDQVNKGILWGEEHTDFNLLTLLPGGRFYNPEGKPAGPPDDKSGLYLRTRANAEHPQGRMVRGIAPEGCIVAQVGQQLEILTGGVFLATPHVITAPGVPGWTRISSAHFIHLQSNQFLFPLEKFQTPETIRNYSPPVLAGTYAIKTLVDIGLAPKEALDKLGYRHYDRLDAMRARK
ncbi:MAG: 2-oxoglutarate and iron-dependent oxygenase domain-containing protein [Myxococcales bacterium]|nr:isopenicillin N synthase family oxygenase [Polyangiaceae bacterium]MDW8250802.1 2-oxoglutarate and iron-dependent oxygenase domain-containing protein [Myxococcales bacterium]